MTLELAMVSQSLSPERLANAADSPPATALEAHCRRVAALSYELGRRLDLPPRLLHLLEAAGLRHHEPRLLHQPGSLNRLAIELGLDPFPVTSENSASVSELLRSFWWPSGSDNGTTAFLADIVRAADHFVEQWEFTSFEYRSASEILDEITQFGWSGLIAPEVAVALNRLPRATFDTLFERIDNLPSLPAVALEALDPATDSGLPVLAELALSEPTLSDALLNLADSDLCGGANPADTIAGAIQNIGMNTARKVLLTTLIRPIFAGASHRALWEHSLLVAHLAESLAAQSECVAPNEAFLAGLLHDVGRLLYQKLPGDVGTVADRMLRRSGDVLFVESVVSHTDHCELGLEILHNWGLPDSIASGVRYHHHPELSGSMMAALLYLAEYWSGSEEDSPSAARLRLSMERTGISFDTLQSASVPSGLIENLLRAA